VPDVMDRYMMEDNLRHHPCIDNYNVKKHFNTFKLEWEGW
jgi:hypothetical protein